MLHQTVSGAADQSIVQRRMAHIAHYEQVKALSLDKFADR